MGAERWEHGKDRGTRLRLQLQLVESTQRILVRDDKPPEGRSAIGQAARIVNLIELIEAALGPSQT